ncbi:MAG: glycosyltransferase [Conexivisphaerales archaeon]
MPNRNNAKFIQSAIDSVLKQAYSNVELIVVDDGSEDNSLDIVEHFLRVGREIRLLKTGGRRGSAAARNLGIKNARGECIAFIDSDDMWVPSKLQRQMEEYLLKGPCIVYHDWMRIDESGNILPAGKLRRPKKSGRVFDEFLSMAFGASSMFLVPRRYLDSAHMFDESLPWAEDLDFSLKLARDFMFSYVDERLYCYRIHNRSKTMTMPRMKRIEWECRVIERHFEASKNSIPDETRQRVIKLLGDYYKKTHQYHKLLALKLKNAGIE